jgi:nucleotide sugar dehydrogenase
VGSAETAEMIKLAETTYRDINIAFANELARFSDEWGIDVSTVIDAANSQPYSHIHRPGVGVGGHCIPHYPYLLESSTSGSKLVREARHINEGMPVWVIDRLEAECGGLAGRIIVALGIAYRPGVREVASSPTFDLARELDRRGAKLVVADPLYSADEIDRLGLTAWAGEEPSALILVTDHDEYRSFSFEDYPPMCIVDGRNVWDRTTVERAGHTYIGVGR